MKKKKVNKSKKKNKKFSENQNKKSFFSKKKNFLKKNKLQKNIVNKKSALKKYGSSLKKKKNTFFSPSRKKEEKKIFYNTYKKKHNLKISLAKKTAQKKKISLNSSLYKPVHSEKKNNQLNNRNRINFFFKKKKKINNFKKKKQHKKKIFMNQNFQRPKKNIQKNIIIRKRLTVIELANKMAIKLQKVIEVITHMGLKVKKHELLKKKIAKSISEKMGHKVIIRHKENELERSVISDLLSKKKDNMKTRAPIVTVMGHVDHGKTSLLDRIRLTNLAKKEHGGITQKIGAYRVKRNSAYITFLDTPGHSAFTSIRSKGAKVTDIIVLVVAVDDGVMPQTIEAIKHAKIFNVPIIVAINKIDKGIENLQEIKNSLTKYSILPEEWGGDNIFINISSKTGEGIEDLLDAILLQAEMLELKDFTDSAGFGIVIEAGVDTGKGPIATIIVKEGKIKVGDIVLCGYVYGKIRSMRNELGNFIKYASASTPVEIFGLSGIPVSGEKIFVVNNKSKAKELAQYRRNKFRENQLNKNRKINHSDVFLNINKEKSSRLNIVLKSDLQGSLEAISSSLQKLSNKKTQVNIVSSGVGGITETDISLAIATKSIVLGFNVKMETSAKKLVLLERIHLRYYTIIYELIDEVKLILKGVLSPLVKEKSIGLVEVRTIFKTPKLGTIAGCIVLEGIIKRNCIVHVIRENLVVYKGQLESLRRFKDNISEVSNGMECGIKIKNYNDIKVKDKIEALENVK